MVNKVVAHYRNGRLVKGTSFDVDPDKPKFHVTTEDQDIVEVKLADLKALFFVKDLKGNPEHREGQAVDPADARARSAKRLDILFDDGERLAALAMSYSPTRVFFFVLPVDPGSNNIRILVNRAAVTSVSFA
jgi:hypothetical protein